MWFLQHDNLLVWSISKQNEQRRREKHLAGPAACPSRKSTLPEMPFPAFLGVILQNSEDYKKLYKKYTKDNTFLVFEYVWIFFIVFLRIVA